MKQDRVNTFSCLNLLNPQPPYLLQCFCVFLLFGSVLTIGITFYLNDFKIPANVSSLSHTTQTKYSSLSIQNQTEPTLTQQAGLNDSLSCIPPKLMNHMSDQELIWRALRVPRNQKDSLGQNHKVAFMFLTRGPLPLAPLWQRFFQGIDQGLYSIYIHSHPSFNQTWVRDSVFYGRSIPGKAVRWGKVDMIDAERRLLANALIDYSNQRFVLLSESCIPLFNFSTIYTYLMNSTKNYVEADLPGKKGGQDRYNSRMKPLITLNQWQKGSQWFQINRALAIGIVSDNRYFPVFKSYCKALNCGEEQYLPTFVSIKFWKTNSKRTLTWADWSKGGSHPSQIKGMRIAYDFLEKLRHGRTCDYNGKITNICYLFARKFKADALNRLLLFAPKIMQFN